jgi:hypothetical protein
MLKPWTVQAQQRIYRPIDQFILDDRLRVGVAGEQAQPCGKDRRGKRVICSLRHRTFSCARFVDYFGFPAPRMPSACAGPGESSRRFGRAGRVDVGGNRRRVRCLS